MARGMELAVVLLDVGPAMAPHLPIAARALNYFLLSKMVHKPAHEVALVLFGTTGTSNPLNEEFLAAEGDDSQYRDITLAVPLRTTSVDHLRAAADVAPGAGRSDLLDAMTVASDLLKRTFQDRPNLEKQTVAKRILVFSSFQGPTQEDEEGVFISALVEQLQSMGAQLDVVAVAGEGAGGQAAEPATAAALAALLAGVRHTRRDVRGPLELLAACRFKEYLSTSYFAGPLCISPRLQIRVKVCKKTGQEKLPSMERTLAGDAVILERESRPAVVPQLGAAPVASGQDAQAMEEGGAGGDAVDPAFIGRAYQYGDGGFVPIIKEVEDAIKFTAEKSFEVLGVVPADSAPANVFIGDTWLVAPDKAASGAHAALAAVVRCLRDEGLALLARFAPRGSVTLGLLTPMPAEAGQPAALVMRYLPFEQDLRAAAFPSFAAHEELLPNVDQTASIDALIDALRLDDGEHEVLAPERTGNPALHRFLDCVGQRRLAGEAGAAAALPEDGGLAERALQAQLDNQQAAQALEGVAAIFKVATEDAEEVEMAEAWPTPKAVGFHQPVQDFEKALGWDPDLAFEGMAAAIRGLVEGVDGVTRSAGHQLALECLQRLRSATRMLPFLPSDIAAFNALLNHLAGAASKGDEAHVAFWAAALAADVQPLTEEHDADGGMGPAEARVFQAEAEAFRLRNCETQPMES